MMRAGLTIMLLFTFPAHAGEFGDWLKELYIPGTRTSCCLPSDCRKLTSDEWRVGPEGYEAIVNGRWRQIPPKNLVRRPEGPDEAVLCSRGDQIYCFREGILT
ncbi:MAG: hypothetical protein NUV72_08620 [Bauldia sp.]|nr:hypothetical protein [Bauldia sp.]